LLPRRCVHRPGLPCRSLPRSGSRRRVTNGKRDVCGDVIGAPAARFVPMSDRHKRRRVGECPIATGRRYRSTSLAPRRCRCSSRSRSRSRSGHLPDRWPLTSVTEKVGESLSVTATGVRLRQYVRLVGELETSLAASVFTKSSTSPRCRWAAWCEQRAVGRLRVRVPMWCKLPSSASPLSKTSSATGRRCQSIPSRVSMRRRSGTRHGDGHRIAALALAGAVTTSTFRSACTGCSTRNGGRGVVCLPDATPCS